VPADCKEKMKFVELRHLDGAQGNFAIGDRRQIRMHAIIKKGVPPTQMLRSTVRSFVEQQQYVFAELWKKAIPAVERIKEIEEGVKREFIEIIRDPSEIQKLSYELIRSASAIRNEGIVLPICPISAATVPILILMIKIRGRKVS
jgi:two-component system, OmpR family, sensor histidine kinase VicK